MNLDQLQTPCLVLDYAILAGNLKRMSDKMRKHGVALRPHMKTAKSADVARLATNGEAGGITVSTIAEANYFASRGFNDITLAVGITPEKLNRLSVQISSNILLNVITDDVGMARVIAKTRDGIKAFIEIDSGESRGGVDPRGDALLEIGRALGNKLAGVLTHAGHSYDCHAVEEIKQVAESERAAVTTAAHRLRAEGMRCDVVSVGSTPSMSHVENMEFVTVARPGVYMFQDLFQAAIESCTRDDIAVTVLASVINCRPSKNQIVIDAGSLALSKDRSTAATNRDAGFGLVLDIDGRPSFGECIIQHAYQEHGVATSSQPLPFERLKIGTKVRVAPNHSCLTAAAHDRYHVVHGGREILHEWDRVNGW
ncbi:MAG TPA: alanine racemase [Gemmatimonadaceae bacterium]|nr:alanine racemase [Gemmatimonadaceae bacterium]